jgi:hypothetical protein
VYRLIVVARPGFRFIGVEIVTADAAATVISGVEVSEAFIGVQETKIENT